MPAGKWICLQRELPDPAVVEQFKANDNRKQAASKGGSIDRSWVERTLQAKGFEIIDGVYLP